MQSLNTTMTRTPHKYLALDRGYCSRARKRPEVSTAGHVIGRLFRGQVYHEVRHMRRRTALLVVAACPE